MGVNNRDLQSFKVSLDVSRELIKYAAKDSLLISESGLTDHQLGPQEAFVLSRINDEWDVKSILSICPFREVDSLQMIKTLLDRGIIGF